MAPKKDKSKVEDEAVANLSIGWRKSKMSQEAVQELENIGLLQSHAVIQWHIGEGEDYPIKALKPLCFMISWNAVLHFLCQNSSILFCNSGESNCVI